MSEELNQAKAQLRFVELNRRARLLEIAQGTPLKHWPLFSLVLIAGGLIVLAYGIMPLILPLPAFDSGSGLFLLAIAFIIALVWEVTTLRKRLNALVQLLKEDGVLQSEPPTTKLLSKE